MEHSVQKKTEENEDGCAVRDEIPQTEWPTVPVCTETDGVPWVQGFQESPGKPGQDGHPTDKDVLCYTLERLNSVGSKETARDPTKCKNR